MIYANDDDYTLYIGKMQDELKDISDNSIDSIITDPPYELNFMNKGWDRSGVAFQKETWEECLRVLKPGGHLLAFGGSRTFHRIACAIEDAGFEIRDTIMWLYGQGFPKSTNIGLAIDKKNGVDSKVVGHSNNGSGKQPNKLDNHCKGDTGLGYADGSYKEFDIKEAQNEWKGWGTQLKPAFEPIIMARKPCEDGVINNTLKYGVGGLNIDECRINFISEKDYEITANKNQHENFGTKPMTNNNVYGDYSMVQPKNYVSSGRFPANIITDGSEEVAEGFPYSKGASSQNNYSNGHIYRGQSLEESETSLSGYREWYNDEGSAMRYFYCAKASKKDRDSGLDEFELKDAPIKGYRPLLDKEIEAGMSDHNDFMRITPKKNNHPTVKPCELMQYLIRLVSPKGSTILDPFMGSGSTGKAAMIENVESDSNYKFIGIEMTSEYLPIAEARIKYGKHYIDNQNDSIKNTVKNVEDSQKEISVSDTVKLF